MGVLARVGGKPAVVEYSEISAQMAELIADDGSLVYGDAHICVNCFSIEFLRRQSQSNDYMHGRLT